jgi:hypothetical protein
MKTIVREHAKLHRAAGHLRKRETIVAFHKACGETVPRDALVLRELNGKPEFGTMAAFRFPSK